MGEVKKIERGDSFLVPQNRSFERRAAFLLSHFELIPVICQIWTSELYLFVKHTSISCTDVHFYKFCCISNLGCQNFNSSR